MTYSTVAKIVAFLPSQAKTKYTIDVLTSDVKGADFEGLAYMTLSGWWGASKEVSQRRPNVVAVFTAQRNASTGALITVFSERRLSI
jgi:hypothetical protein